MACATTLLCSVCVWVVLLSVFHTPRGARPLSMVIPLRLLIELKRSDALPVKLLPARHILCRLLTKFMPLLGGGNNTERSPSSSRLASAMRELTYVNAEVTVFIMPVALAITPSCRKPGVPSRPYFLAISVLMASSSAAQASRQAWDGCAPAMGNDNSPASTNWSEIWHMRPSWSLWLTRISPSMHTDF